MSGGKECSADLYEELYLSSEVEESSDEKQKQRKSEQKAKKKKKVKEKKGERDENKKNKKSIDGKESTPPFSINKLLRKSNRKEAKAKATREDNISKLTEVVSAARSSRRVRTRSYITLQNPFERYRTAGELDLGNELLKEIQNSWVNPHPKLIIPVGVPVKSEEEEEEEEEDAKTTPSPATEVDDV